VGNYLWRLVLVIGNQNYPQAPLINPINDAQTISASLADLGFEVHTVLDSLSVDFKDEISEFYMNIKGVNAKQSLAIFYYAGHVIQIEHHN
jgi:uncharacterized caspase-like protein